MKILTSNKIKSLIAVLVFALSAANGLTEEVEARVINRRYNETKDITTFFLDFNKDGSVDITMSVSRVSSDTLSMMLDELIQKGSTLLVERTEMKTLTSELAVSAILEIDGSSILNMSNSRFIFSHASKKATSGFQLGNTYALNGTNFWVMLLDPDNIRSGKKVGKIRLYEYGDNVASGTYTIFDEGLMDLYYDNAQGSSAHLKGKTFRYIITSTISFRGTENGETWMKDE